MAENEQQPRDDLSPLLEDCRRVSLFGAHTGRLSDGKLLQLEIELRDQIGSDSGPQAETIDALCTELNRGLHAIAPITLAHLQSWDVKKRSFRNNVLGYLSILILSMVIFAGCWHFTTWDTEARLIVGEARAFDFERKLESERSLYKWLGTASTDFTAEMASERSYSDWIAGSGYLAEFERSRQEYWRIAEALASIRGSYPAFHMSGVSISNSLCSIAPDWGRPFFCPRSTSYTPSDRLKGYPAPPPASGTQQLAGQATRSVSVAAKPDTDRRLKELGLDLAKKSMHYDPPPEQCQKISDVLLQDLKTEVFAEGVDLDTALFEWEVKRGRWFVTHLLCARTGEWSKIAYYFTQPSFANLTEVENLLQEVSSWLLPSLYGALGAALFSLRMLLDPHYPNPPLYRFLIRAIAGAFAGFAVVRFVTPDVANAFGLTWLVSFGHLALAFLAGFAVEILLKELADRTLRIGSKFDRDYASRKLPQRPE